VVEIGLSLILVEEKRTKVLKKLSSLTQVLQELETETNSVKKQEYVPRHIELTAVLREILKQKNKSNRIEI
jgi:hypothetical protein